MFYLDTSLILSGLTPEAATQATLDWLDAHREDDLAVSDWTITEVASALAIKRRTGQIEEIDRLAALAEFERAVTASYIVLPVRREQFRAAARLMEMVETGLRAGDALHVAVARDAGAILATLDRRLAGWDEKFGITTALLAPGA